MGQLSVSSLREVAVNKLETGRNIQQKSPCRSLNAQQLMCHVSHEFNPYWYLTNPTTELIVFSQFSFFMLT